MRQPQSLADALRQESSRPHAEMKAYLIVQYGLAPEAASDLADKPLQSADHIDALLPDIEKFLRP